MPLQRYRSMRRFDETPEPRGARPGNSEKLSFVVQKHAASRLHYDFRLEVGGVLVSWAVPKGPSTTPGEKRLAVHVEDHPLEYGSFEGVIPKGQYGAGTVEIWDKGTWVPEGDPKRGIRAGNLKFQLKGRKLKGGWALVRMAPHDDEKGKENWLLIKHDDARGTGADAA
ncbi:MAG TPA: DNA polymerase ligase N-terminal domain-containing protein, partial [Candidatus Eisenbacteria bacterium]